MLHQTWSSSKEAGYCLTVGLIFHPLHRWFHHIMAFVLLATKAIFIAVLLKAESTALEDLEYS